MPVLATFFNVRRGRDSFFKFFMRSIFPRQVGEYEEKFEQFMPPADWHISSEGGNSMTTIIRYACVTWLSTLLFPVPVQANATPGFGGVSSLILLWLAVALFTAVGGGYVVRKKLLLADGKK